MFRALLAHPQEVLHEQPLVYCGRVVSVGCTNPDADKWQHARNIPSALYAAPPEGEQLMLETCSGLNS
jgi:hypothetical protein